MLTAKDFAGRWRLDRVLEDRLGAMSGTLAGEAVFAAEQSGLLYRETGTLCLRSGPQMQAERSYVWAWRGEEVAVTFADGADFHTFVPDGAVEGTPHLCGQDLYHVAYDFRDWPRWSARWEVAGPRKDYVSTSTYCPN